MRSAASLYVHLPFCSRKCPYCHFFVLPNDASHREQLLEGLRLEWNREKKKLKGFEIVSLYFGGGTPALMGPPAIREIIGWLGEVPAEVTLEVNPEEITEALLHEFAEAGVNRISYGVQSFDDTLLHTLGRGHNASQARRALQWTADAGISNVTIDLMIEVPGQTVETWEATLDEVANLPITHLSLYNLTFEPNTSFYKRKKQLQRLVVDEQAAIAMYELAQTKLPAMGLEQYEISAYSRRGKESIHNSGYWEGRPFLGLGPSAYSYWNGQRYRNVAHLGRYCRALVGDLSPVDYEEAMDPDARSRELLAVGLRQMKGVNLSQFSLAKSTNQSIQRLVEEELLWLQGETLSLTKRGVLLYDTVASELI